MGVDDQIEVIIRDRIKVNDIIKNNVIEAIIIKSINTKTKTITKDLWFILHISMMDISEDILDMRTDMYNPIG